MSLNRIYQGKVTSCSLVTGSGKQLESATIENFAAESAPLFQHHKAFQDAVNYYLLALVAMADTSKSGPLTALSLRMAEAWEPFYKRGKHFSGLKASLRPWLALAPNSTIHDCYAKILEANTAQKNVLDLAATSLVLDLGGDSKIQQGGRTYLPLLCDPKTTANFPRSAMVRKKNEGKAILPSLLWSAENDQELVKVAEALHFEYFANPTTDGSKIKADDAKDKLKEALKEIAEKTSISSALKDSLATKIEQLPNNLVFPNYTGGSINKEALKTRFYLYLLIHHVSPDLELLTILRDSFPEPSSAKRILTYTPPAEELQFQALSDDPIALARGDRGFVFKAFTALPCWIDSLDNRSAWKEFDIAAFKEALTTINQFKAKTEERRQQQEHLENCIDYIYGKSTKKPKAQDIDEENFVIHTFSKDPRLQLIEQITKDLGVQDTDYDHGITKAGLRGFRDIKASWRKLKSKGNTTPEKLVEVVSQYQKDNPRSVGDSQLFRELSKLEYHSLWEVPSEETETLRNKLNQPVDALYAFVVLADYKQQLAKAKEPINFTPADPILSRRLFMFSDITGKHKNKLDLATNSVDLSVAYEASGNWSIQRLKLKFSAPRIRRDNIQGGKAALWMPPVTQGLEIPEQLAKVEKEPAMSYMPTLTRDGAISHLLNFPVSFDETPLKKAIGKEALWNGNFNGTSNNKIHLLWSSIGEAKAKGAISWWRNPHIIENGFNILAVDLGLRSAAACSILEVQTKGTAHYKGKNPFTDIGHDGKNTWEASLRAQFSIKLPGEGAKEFRDGKWQTEIGGNRGRASSEEEWQQALAIADLLIQSKEQAPEAWLGENHKIYTYAEQNDKLIKLLKALLSRYRNFFRCSWQLAEGCDSITKVFNILSSYQSEPTILKCIENKSPSPKDLLQLKEQLRQRLDELKSLIQRCIEAIANRLLPQRDYTWRWEHHSTDYFSDRGWMELTRQPSIQKNQVKPWGQRGIAAPRIEQLENFRRLLMSFNRSQMETFAVKPLSGAEKRNDPMAEVAEELLTKIDHMKTERVNLTAHHILAQALGVRLDTTKANNLDPKADVHGCYIPTPNRKPVDFIVMEDLRRYQTSADRAPSENRQLAKWCHSQIIDKLKELCEPYGITVLETQPAYTSKFCSRHHSIGFRARKVTLKDAQSGYAKALAKRDKLTPLQQQDHLLHQILLEAESQGKKIPFLWQPKDGAEFFISPIKKSGKLSIKEQPSNADLNASVNIGLAAICAPEAIHILRKIRAEQKAGKLKLVKSNKREKALKKQNKLTASIRSMEALKGQNRFNIFPDIGGIADFGKVEINELNLPLTIAKGIFAGIKNNKWQACMLLNQQLLNKVDHTSDLLESYQPVEDEIDPDDDIPNQY